MDSGAIISFFIFFLFLNGMERIDCAIGIQPACEKIQAKYIGGK